MKGFKFLNFHTVYSSIGTVGVKLEPHACFSSIFHGPLEQNNLYHIHVYKGMNLFHNSLSNGCFLELNDIKKHLNTLKHITKIKFVITENIDAQINPYYDISFRYSGSNIQHRFILTWIRALYEFPYCIYLPELYALKKESEFKFINPFNILNIIAAAHCNGDDIHMFTNPGCFSKLLKYNDIKNELNKHKNNHCLFEIFGSQQVNTENSISDDFLNKKLLQERKKVYLDIYKKIKHGV